MIGFLNKVLVTTLIFTRYARRNPGVYFLGVVFFPLSLLVPLLLLTTRTVWSQVLIGAAICSTTIMTVSDISDIVSRDRYTRSITYFMTRPVRPIHYVLGVGLSTLVYNLVGIGAVLLCSALLLDTFLTWVQGASLVLILLVAWLIAAAIGFLVGALGPRDPRANVNIATLIAYVLTFLAPVYYPPSILPPVAQALSKCLYSTHLAALGRAVLTDSPFSPVNLIAIVVFVGAALLSLAKLARWSED